MRTELRKAGADEALQPVHLQALIYLARANRYSNTPQALAEYLGLTKGTVSQTLLLLDRQGLRSALEGYVGRWGRDGGPALALELPPDLPRLAPEVEVAAYRIVTEALANVVRHSTAAHRYDERSSETREVGGGGE